MPPPPPPPSLSLSLSLHKLENLNWLGLERGRWKKICTNSHKKRKGGGSANAPHCARSASDRRTRPFFPLSATNALWTTALVLVSQGFGCPMVVQSLSKRVQWRGRELSNSAIIICGRQVCSGSETLRFFSPCDGDVHAVWSGVPCMPLIFTTSGSLGEGKVRFVRVLQSPPLSFPVKSRVCRCLQSVPSPWKYHHLWPRVELVLQHWHRWAVKRQSERFQGWKLRTTSISQRIWLIPGSRWTGHEQAWTKSTSPKSITTQTQSQRKKIQLSKWREQACFWRQNSNYHRKWREQACFNTFSTWRQISNSNRMRNICRNGARSEADLAQCGALALPPHFLFFLWPLVQFFFQRPLV